MTIWQYLILLLSVLLGGGLAQYVFTEGRGAEDRWRNALPLLLSFSGAYLLGIAAMELMPTVYSDPNFHTGVWLISGFLIQLLLESFSQGVEHGHVHAHQHAGVKYALSVMIGLGIHAVLEGLPLGTVTEVSGHAHAHADGDHLLWGIVLHKIPAAFALALLLRSSGFTLTFTWACVAVFGTLSPAGAWLGEIITIDPVWTNRVLALVIGSFLHISTTIIFEADGGREHGVSVMKLVVVLLGVVVAYLTAH